MMDSKKKMAMMEALEELLEMVEEMEMSDYESEDMPMPELGERMGDMQKVTVASDSPEGLKEGLSKADELLEQYKSMEGKKSKKDKE